MKAFINGIGQVEGTPEEIVSLKNLLEAPTEKCIENDVVVFVEPIALKERRKRSTRETILIEWEEVRVTKRRNKGHGCTVVWMGRKGKAVDAYIAISPTEKEHHLSYDSIREAAADLNLTGSAISHAMAEQRTTSSPDGTEYFFKEIV